MLPYALNFQLQSIYMYTSLSIQTDDSSPVSVVLIVVLLQLYLCQCITWITTILFVVTTRPISTTTVNPETYVAAASVGGSVLLLVAFAIAVYCARWRLWSAAGSQMSLTGSATLQSTAAMLLFHCLRDWVTVVCDWLITGMMDGYHSLLGIRCVSYTKSLSIMGFI